MKRYLGILFDFDGTLVDSWDLVCQSFKSSLKKHYPCKPISNIDRMRFMSFPSYIDQYIYALDGESPSENFVRDTESYYRENLHMTPLVPNCGTLLSFLYSQKIPCGVVSNKKKEFLLPIMSNYSDMDFFKVVITLDDVVYPKPHPEGIFKALKEMKLKSKDCLYVGDALSDIEAAKEADMDIAILDRNSDNLSAYNPTYNIKDIFEVRRFIE